MAGAIVVTPAETNTNWETGVCLTMKCWSDVIRRLPVQQLQSDSIPVVMGNQIHTLIAEAQMGHQGLH